MAKQIFIATAIATTILAALTYRTLKKDEKYSPASVQINGHTVKVELANSPATRAKGMMYRDDLGAEEGMFFIFSTEGKHRFWMANTYIPLDIIWISKNNKIVDIKENAEPCSKTGKLQSLCTLYKPAYNAKYVLEVNAGWVAEKQISIGDDIEFIQ